MTTIDSKALEAAKAALWPRVYPEAVDAAVAAYTAALPKVEATPFLWARDPHSSVSPWKISFVKDDHYNVPLYRHPALPSPKVEGEPVKWPPLVDLGRVLHFFASVIKSGEPWTSTCEDAYNAANQALKDIYAERSSPSPVLADEGVLPYAFITSTSDAPNYYVTIKTKTLDDTHRWHDALLALQDGKTP